MKTHYITTTMICTSFFHHNVTKLETYKPYLIMFFVQLVYAGMALLSKVAISKGMNPYVFVVYRQAIASLILAPFAYFCERKTAPPLSYNLICKIFMISLCGTTLSLNLYYYAINYTTATFAAASTNTIPAITFIIAVILRIESLKIKRIYGVAKVVGSVIGLVGALVYAFLRGPSVKFDTWYPTFQVESQNQFTVSGVNGSKWDWVKGSLIMLCANTVWSLWLVFQSILVKEYPAILRLITLQCFFSCIQSACWAVTMERNASAWKLGWDIHLVSVTYCGIFVTALSYWLQIRVMEKKGPVFTSTFAPFALIVTAIFSTFLWKETIYLGSVLGATLLVIGLYAVLWGKNKEWIAAANKLKEITNAETVAMRGITIDK